MQGQKPETAHSINPGHDSLANLQEPASSNNQKTQNIPKVSFFQLFRFATKADIILLVVGSLASLAMGAALPAFALLWGEMTDSFGAGGDAMVDKARQIMFIFFGIGGGALVAGWLMFACWMIAGERQAIACRKAYLQSLLRQEIGWFDMINQSQLSSKFATDCSSYQGALGQKNSSILMTVGMFIAGFAIAFSIGWLMTLVMLATIPAIGLTGYIFMWSVQEKDQKTSKDYSEAGGLAQQALAAIKTVKMLNGENWQAQQYKKCLISVTKKAVKFAVIAGLGIGSMFGVMLMSYSLGFWYGSHCVEVTHVCDSGQKYTAGDVLIIFFSILMAGFNFSQLTPALKKIAQGRQAAARIYQIIDREPKIKNPPNPIRPTSFKGIIKFENVTFSYPKEPNRKILDNITLDFSTHSSALVGESGCGKSTIFQLLMRFYDPDEGRITLDGIDLRDLDLVWLRENIGYVGQEPVLFATSIRENLSFGKEDATDQEITEALKKAEAYDFVQTLENKLETYVGTGGGQLSGGQKQRIAIARALLRDPKILLLDEATSALDRKNERLIQETLDKIAQQRTTITIAHRTKTIMHCNMIYVLDKGKIQERGRFTELSRFKGVTFDKEQEQIQKEQKQKTNQKKSAVKNNQTVQQKKKNGFIDFTTLEVQSDDKNKNKEQEQKAQKEKLMKKYESGTYGRVLSYGKGAMWAFALAALMAAINGAIFPVFSIFLSKMLATLILFDNDRVQARQDANLYALIFLILGVVAFIANFFQMLLFSLVGQEITKKIRIEVYSKMLKMPIIWFDIPKNNPGGLTARLAADCKMVNGLTTTFIGISIQNVVTLGASLIIGFIFEWRTSLVTLGLIPIMILAGAVQMKQSLGFSGQSDTAYKDSSSLITEAMVNIRTVMSFGYENVVLHKYSFLLEKPFQLGVKKGNVSGVLYGITQFIMFLIFALIFFLGTVFIRDNENVKIEDVFTAIYAIVFGAMTVGNNSHFLPDIAASKQAAASLFQIIDSEDEDQIQVRENSKLLKSGIQGDIELRNVSFKYATRSNELFKNFSLSLRKGTKVAFVGHSGCGKSTIFQMILRFYDPSEGDIYLDGHNIKDYDIHYLRTAIGVVSQEPVLFNGSFRYNMVYNLPGVTDQQMIAAAHEANAYAFIKGSEALEGKQEPVAPKKDDSSGEQREETKDSKSDEEARTRDEFDRSVGIKGSHISGGQKQRVAIARTILRNPVILLLDEATSALDSANEKKVQESLDKIMTGRTTISIAHRIDTIKNSDEIDVFDHGRVVEKGTYRELVSRKGYFYNLERGTDFL